MNAKKLDVNFDGDDFFNSFEPSKNTSKQEVGRYTSKLKEVDDPFDLVP